jgi:hypothetical protein
VDTQSTTKQYCSVGLNINTHLVRVHLNDWQKQAALLGSQHVPTPTILASGSWWTGELQV